VEYANHSRGANSKHWDVPLATLRGILKSRRVRRVWEVTESGFPDAKELDVALFIPDGTETFWTSEKMDWMIYASHVTLTDTPTYRSGLRVHEAL
jgi:hypothetical protein